MKLYYARFIKKYIYNKENMAFITLKVTGNSNIYKEKRTKDR